MIIVIIIIIIIVYSPSHIGLGFLYNDIVSYKTAHGFIVKLKLLDITRFLKGQDVRPN